MLRLLVGLRSYELVEDALLKKMHILTKFNFYLSTQSFPDFWTTKGFEENYGINLESVGFDFEHRCITFWVDHLPTGSSWKLAFKRNAPMPLLASIKSPEPIVES